MRKIHIWPFFGLIAATGLWLVSAGANIQAGMSLSEDETVRHILGGASLSADLMKVAALLAAWAAWQNRRWVIFLSGVLLFILCSIWSYRAGAVFIAEVLAQRSAQAQHAKKIIEKSQDLITLKERRAGFLSQQNLTTTSKSRSAIEAVAQERKRTGGEFASLTEDIAADIETLRKTPPPRTDALAGFLADKGVIPKGDEGEHMLWTITAAFFALLLEMGSGLGFLTITRARHPRQIAVKVEPEAPRQIEQQPAPVLQAAPQAPQEAPQAPVQAQPIPEPPKPLPVPAKRPVAPPAPSNVVSLSGEPIQAEPPGTSLDVILGRLLQPSADERVLLSDVVALVNSNLPRHRRLTTAHKVTQLLPPALDQAGLQAHKAKVGGKVYLLGVAVKPAARTRRA